MNGAGVPTDTLRFDANHHHPVWQLCSWNFPTELSSGNPSNTKYGITYTDGNFSIARDKDGTITMGVLASRVYKTARTGSDPWINFLMQCDFPTIPIAKAGELTLSYEVRIAKCRNKMGNKYDSSIHAAQCLYYFYVRNTNPESADFNKGIWLGMGYFDNRFKKGMNTEVYCNWDNGTSTYIYSLPGQKVFGGVNLKDKKWHKASVDVFEAIKDACSALSTNGFFKDSQPQDFSITGMNFGWELPGTFDVKCQVRNFSVLSDVPLTGNNN